MYAYLFHEKPILCNNRQCMASANKYFMKRWINKNGREVGGFYECKACGAMYVHLMAYKSKIMHGEIVLLNPEDENTIVGEYVLKKQKIKKERLIEKQNRREKELDEQYIKDRVKREEDIRYYNYDKEGFLLYCGKPRYEVI